MAYKVSDAFKDRMHYMIKNCMMELVLAEQLPEIFAHEIRTKNVTLLYIVTQLMAAAGVRNEIYKIVKEREPSMFNEFERVVQNYDQFNSSELISEMQGEVPCTNEAVAELARIFAK